MTTREAFFEKLKARLDQLNARLELLEAKAEEQGADLQLEYEQRLEELREQERDVRRRIQEIKTSSEVALNDVQRSADKAIENLKQGIEAATGRFSDL